MPEVISKVKKIKFKTIVVVFACILGIQLWGLLYGLFLVGIINHENSYLITYNDINLYAEDAYFNLSTYEDYLFVSKKCSEYLPKSEGFKYWDNIKGFYIHDGAKTLTLTAISFVLELQFENTKVLHIRFTFFIFLGIIFLSWKSGEYYVLTDAGAF